MALPAAGQTINLKKPVEYLHGLQRPSLENTETEQRSRKPASWAAENLHTLAPAISLCIKENKAGIIALSCMQQPLHAETTSLTSPASFYN